MDFSQIINKEAVHIGYAAKDKDDALRHMIDLLYKAGAVSSPEEFLEDVYLRESEGITGIGGGIAIPHGKSRCVAQSCIAACRLAKPIQWETIDGDPVSLILLFAVTEQDAQATHLKMMAGVASALADENICDRIRTAATADALIAAFNGVA